MLRKLLNTLLCLLVLSAGAARAQTRITGTVTSSDDGSPVSFVSVSVKEFPNIGMMADAQGNYAITLPAGGTTLVFSLIGMNTTEVEVHGRTVINVVMDPESTAIDEVLVVAYGTVNRASYTGAANQLTSEQFAQRPISNISQGLSGMAAGVQISGASGQPGSDVSIRIRGTNSISGSPDPLFIVDGAPYENALSSISPDDIESLTILKDASSAALYGARAANGIVIITTKQGKVGKPRFNVKVTQGFTTEGLGFYETIDKDDYYPLNWERVYNQYSDLYVSKGTMTDLEARQLASGIINRVGNVTYGSVYNALGYNPYNVPNDEIVDINGNLNPNAKFLWGDDLDWVDQMKRIGYRSEYKLDFSGANERTRYYVSTGYLTEEGFIGNSKFDRMSARANVSTEVTKWMKVGVNLGGNISNGKNQTATSNTTTNPFYNGRFMGPIYPVHMHDLETGEYLLDDNGNKLWDFGHGNSAMPTRPYNASHNMVAELFANKKNYRRSLLSGKVFAEISFLKDFKFTTNYSVDLNTYFYSNYTDPFGDDLVNPGRIDKTNNQRLTWNFNQLLQYVKQIGKHNIDIMAGHEAYSTEFFNLYGEKSGEIASGNVEMRNFTTMESLYSYTRDYRTEGYIVRANYSYDNKYMASASYRRDASTRFHEDCRWGNFWSVGFAWRVEQEEFMRSVRWLDHLKLRSSYGEVGNDNIGNYLYQSLYALSPNATEKGYALTGLGNKDLRWEHSENFDVAIEFSLFNRFRGTVEYFSKKTSDMLYDKPLHPSSGFSSMYDNSFNMYNRGFEIELAADLVKKRDFTWELSVNATHAKNRVTSMPGEPYNSATKRIEVGHSMYEFYLREYMGVDPSTGYALYRAEINDAGQPVGSNVLQDAQGNWVTTKLSEAAYHYCGDAIPKLYGGIINNLSYKNFALGINLTYQTGGKMYDGSYQTLMSYGVGYGRNMHKDILNRWRQPGDITDVPSMNTDRYTDHAGANSDRWIISSDFLEITSINLSYTFPKSVSSKLQLDNLQVYATVDNVYQFTKRKGMHVRNSFAGTTSYSYLPARVFTFGVNLSF